MPIDSRHANAHLFGAGIGTLAAAAFVIRDGAMDGENNTVYEAGSSSGGSLDARGSACNGYTMRGGRKLTTDNYECTWGLFKTILSPEQSELSVYDETIAFNKRQVAHSHARLVDHNRHIVDVKQWALRCRIGSSS